MRRLLIALSILLPLAGAALVAQHQPKTDARVSAITAQTGVTPGALLEEDANTVLHVTWPGYQNLAVRSNEFATLWTPSNATAVDNAAPDPFGGNTASRFTVLGVNGVRYQAPAVGTASTGPFYASAWVKEETSLPLVVAWCGTSGNAATCSCSVLEGVGTCSPTMTGNGCFATVNGAVEWTRVRTNLTCVAAQSAAGISIGGVAAGTMLAYGAQLTREPTTTYVATGATNFFNAPLDAKGNAWTENGDVPLVTASPLYPGSFGTGRKALGPFTDANYFSGAQPLDSHDGFAQRYGCIAFKPTGSYPAFQGLIANGNFNVAGYYVGLSGTTGTFTYTSDTAPAITANAGAPIANAINVGCWWHTGAAVNAKLNLGNTGITAAATPEVSGAAYTMKIGRLDGAGGAFPGQIYEVIQGIGVCPVPAVPYASTCEGWATWQQTRALSIGDPNQALFATSEFDLMHLIGNSYVQGATAWAGQNVPAQPMNLVGTVPVAATHAAPATTGYQNRQGAGPYSGANNYQGPTDLGEWAGDWSVTVVFNPTSSAAAEYLVSKLPATGTAGWGGRLNVGGTVMTRVYDGATKTVSTVNTATVGGINVATFGKAGATCYAVINGGASASVACGAVVSGTEPIWIGRTGGAGSEATTTTIYEVLASTTPYSDALHLARWRRATGQYLADGTPVTTTRATTETVEIPAGSGQTRWTVPASVPAIGPYGMGSFPTTSNTMLQSQTSCVANAVQAPWVNAGAPTCLSDVGVAPDGTTTMDEWTNAVNTDRPGQSVTVASGTTFTGSVYVNKPSGTSASSLLNCVSGAPTLCTCGVSDGSACSTSIVGNNCQANWTALTTTTVRAWNTAVCPTTASVLFYTSPGVYGTSTGTARFWGAQVEPGTTPSPYIATTTAAVQRNSDAITIPNPIKTQDATWCVSGDYVPYVDRTTAQGTINTLWATGTFDAANSARMEIVGTDYTFVVMDSTGAQYRLTYPVASLDSTVPVNVRACVADGRQALYLDGSLVAAGAIAPAGDWQVAKPGVWSTIPSTITVGARVAGTNHWAGYVGGFTVERQALTKDALAALDARLVLAAPATSVGALLDEDANTTFHWVPDEWNMVRFPEALDNAAWTVAPGMTVTPNTDTAPNGTLTADTVTRAAGGDQSIRPNYIVGTAEPYTYSVWMKAGSTTTAGLGWYNGGFATATCKIESGPGTAPACAVSGLSTTQWTRVSMTGTLTASPFWQVLLYPETSGVGTAGLTIKLWGAQVVRGSVALPYKSPVGDGDTLTMAGTVPVVTTSPLFADGFGTGRRAVGPFSDANYIAPYGTTTSDPLDSTGDRWGCVAFVPASIGTQQILYSNGLSGTSGHWVEIQTTGSFRFATVLPANITVSTPNFAVASALNVGCWWRTGTTISAKLNLGATTVQTGAGVEVSGTAYAAKIGRYEAAALPFPGTIVETIQGLGACPGGSCEAWATQQQAQALANGDPTQPLFTPTSTALLHLRGNDYTGGPLWQSEYLQIPEVGTVGYSDAFVPPIDGALQNQGYGPYSAANYFSGPTSLGEWTGDWNATVVFNASISGAYQVLAAKGNATVGWYCAITTTGQLRTWAYDGVAKVADTATIITPGAINVATCGRSGSVLYARLNNGPAVTSVAIGTMTAATAEAFRVGRWGGSGSEALTTTIHEVIMGTTPYSDALHEARWRKATGQLTDAGLAITNTRSTPQTYSVPRNDGVPSLYAAPAATTPITPWGIGSWGVGVNSALQSQTSCVANAVQTPWINTSGSTCVTDAGVAPDGTTTMDEWTSVNINGVLYQLTAIASSTTFTASAWASRASGTGLAAIWAQGNGACGSVSACTCGTSDGRACTPSISTTNCRAQFTADTIPVRVWATATCATATVAATHVIVPGEYGVAVGTTRFWGTQMETGLTATPYVATTTASATRNADVITTPIDQSLAYANLAKQSDDVCAAPWSVTGGATCANSTVTTNAAGQYYVQNMVGPSTTGPWTMSYTVEKDDGGLHTSFATCGSGTGTTTVLSCSRSDGVPCVIAGSTYQVIFGNLQGTSVGTDPVRISYTFTCSVAQTQILFRAYGADWTTGAGSAKFSNVQLTVSGSELPYLPTTSAIAYNDQKWCADMYYTPGQPWNVTSNYLFSNYTGTLPNITNLAKTTATITFSVYDTAGTQRSWNYSHGRTDMGGARITACMNNTVLQLWLDGVAVGVAGAAGSGLQTGTLTPLHVGDQNGGTHLNGYVRDFRIVKGVTSPQQIDALYK